MGSVTQEDVHHLEKFLENRGAVSVVDAVSIVARIVENAARPDAASLSSIATARRVLADLLENPSPNAIPKLLDICSLNTSFQVLDVFVLTSAAWKALVAAFISKGASCSTKTAFGVIQCALRSALMMLVRAVSVQHGIRSSDVPDIARCVKITKFYCINAAKCSKALLISENRNAPCSDGLADVLSHAMQLVAVTSHILLFDPVLDSSTLISIQEELCPLIGTALGCILHMMQQIPDDKSSATAVAVFIKCRDKFANTTNFLASCFEDIANHSFLLLAVLHVMRWEVSEIDPGDSNSLPLSQIQDRRWSFFKASLLPTLFQLCEHAYAELVLLRERTTGQPYLDTISSSVAQCIVLACGLRPKEDDRLSMIYFLLQQISDTNPAAAYVAHDGLQSMYENSFNDQGRENLIGLLCRYLRVAFAIESSHLDTRWIPLMTELLARHFNRFGTEKRLSHLLHWTPENEEKGRKRAMNDAPDPLTLRILSSLSTHVVNQVRDATSSGNSEQTIVDYKQESGLFQKLLIFLTEDENKSLSIEKAKDCISRMCTGEHTPAWAIPLIPFTSDTKSSNTTALGLISKELTLSESCAALHILQPASMTSKDIESVCRLSAFLLERHGYSIGPAIAAFVSRSSAMLHGSVSVADWQYLSDVLERTVITVSAAARKDPHWSVVSNLTFYHAALTLSHIRSLSAPQKDRKTLITLPERILPLAEEALERLKISKNASLTLGGRGLVNERLAAEREIRVVRARTRTLRRNENAFDLDLVESLRHARFGISETLCDLSNKNSTDANHIEVKSEIRSLQVLLDVASQLFPDPHDEPLSLKASEKDC
ncbi:hypothetical protein FGB62_29g227 [Gracilaria domingensis]|nr:hypothetical protein FGB62_29g227 [Gracilaria domingensis]